MLPPYPLKIPAGFVPMTAIGLADADGLVVAASAADPVPVVIAAPPAAVMPLVGSASASSLVGPFLPALNRPIMLSLSGSWAGTVTIRRSVDGGANKLPLTVGGTGWAVFSANCNEPIWEEAEAAATFYLDFIHSAGTLNYRVSQ